MGGGIEQTGMNAVEGARKDGRAKGGGEWGAQLQMEGAGGGWGAVREAGFRSSWGELRPLRGGDRGSLASRGMIQRQGRLEGSAGGGSEWGSLTQGARRPQDREGELGGGPAGIGGARGAACARGPVRSRLSRVGPRTGRRDGRRKEGGGRDEAPPHPQTGRPASGAPWWGQAGCLCEMGARAGFPSSIQTPPASPFLTWEQQ